MKVTKHILLTAVVAAMATVAPAAISLNPVESGAAVVVAGTGAAANGPVELFVNGASVGYVVADGSGNFSFPARAIGTGDTLRATASQVWNFNTDGNLEGWSVVGGTGVVSGGVLTATCDGSSGNNVTLNLVGAGTIANTNVTRVFEMRYRIVGTYTAGSGSTVIYDPGAGFQFGPQWELAGQLADFNTTLVDISNGGTNNYTSSGTSQQLAPGANGFAVGAQLVVDYIRVSESFDWEFNNAGDLMNFEAAAGTNAVVAAGALSLTNTVAATNAKISGKFSQIDTARFNRLTVAIDANPTIAPNLIDWQYFGGGPSFAGSGHQVGWTPVPGTYVATTIDLTTAPLFGGGWTGIAALNAPAGGFQPLFPQNANETALVDYIRLHPAAPLGPSPTITATAPASSVRDWEIMN